ncbi:hypothetical protein, partial [Ruegeria sp.]|uniref:hypothetical protein n=1 Tax=Ruegeria sp. TaxID=1879320 RepID=UPI002323C06A
RPLRRAVQGAVVIGDLDVVIAIVAVDIGHRRWLRKLRSNAFKMHYIIKPCSGHQSDSTINCIF